MKKIVADRDIPYLRGVLEPYFDVEYERGFEISPNNLHDAEVLLVRTRTRCDSSLLENSKLKFIGTATIGFDHIDMGYCAARGIEVATAAGCNARGVLQYVGGALEALSRRDGWLPSEKTIGVIGVGNVGSLIAEYCRLWGFDVICCDPPRAEFEGGFSSLDELLLRADIVTFHVPLNRDGRYKTLGMADAEFFDKMQHNAIFINTSRGEVVDEAALKVAISSGKLSATVLDVWNGEPCIDAELAEMITFGTFHIAGYSVQGKANGTIMVVRRLAEWYGLPLTDWTPVGVPLRCVRAIGWNDMGHRIRDYFDIESHSLLLKTHIEDFERLREGYEFRREFF